MNKILNFGFMIDEAFRNGKSMRDLLADVYEMGKKDGMIEALVNLSKVENEECYKTCVATEHCHECSNLGRSDINYYAE